MYKNDSGCTFGRKASCCIFYVEYGNYFMYDMVITQQ